jgi:hypothetical protein
MINQLFPIDLPFLRFSTKPLSLVPALQRLQPTEEAVPLSAT